MNKIFLGLAACLIGLATAGAADAAVVVKKSVTVSHRGHSHGYHRTHGVRYSGGYYYSGRHHKHWGHKVWDVRYGRCHYWEPTLRVYYYYSPGYDAYYPCD